MTVPVETLAEAGLKAGDQLVARADGPGRVVFEREDDPIEEFKGALPGVYSEGFLERVRKEWD